MTNTTQHLSEIAENQEDMKQSLYEIKQLLIKNQLLSLQSPQMKQGDQQPYDLNDSGSSCLGAIKMTFSQFYMWFTGKGAQGMPPVSIDTQLASVFKLVLVLPL